ncbi:MAG: hypothetical protein MJ244_04540 [Clostridia bacterium]|nr:hypothetical protein [Clostridia bacterium]
MDNLDRTLASMLNNEKSISDSIIKMNQDINLMNQGLNKSSEWLFSTDSKMENIGGVFDKIEFSKGKKSDFDMIKKEIR